MAKENRKRVMLTLSNISLSLLDNLIKDTGETYSEFLTRMIVEKSTERNKD